MGMLPNGNLYIQGQRPDGEKLLTFLQKYLKQALELLYKSLWWEEYDFSAVDIISRSINTGKAKTANEILNELKQKGMAKDAQAYPPPKERPPTAHEAQDTAAREEEQIRRQYLGIGMWTPGGLGVY